MAARKSPVPARGYRLSSQDASFIYAETDNTPLHVGAIALFEGKIDFDELKRHIEGRLHLLPLCRQRLRPLPLNLAHAVIEDAPDFRIGNHLFRHELAPGMSEAEAGAEIMRHFSRRLDGARPLWELHSFEGMEGARTALLLKVHHALADGVLAVDLIKTMLESKPEAGAGRTAHRKERWRPARPASRLELLRAAIGERWRATVGAALESGRELMRDPASAARRVRQAREAVRVVAEFASRPIMAAPWNSGLVGRERSLAWTRHSLADFREIGTTFGGSINDVVLTVLTEGAARYLRHHRYRAAGRDFSVGCPVNVRRAEERFRPGNRVSMVFPRTPAEPMDPVERLELVREEMERLKAAHLAQALDRLSPLGEAMPPAIMALAGRAGGLALDAAGALLRLSGYKPRPGGFLLPAVGINFVASNVPGVQAPLYLLGHRCLDQIPLIPLIGTIGYSAVALSYDENLYFGMVAAPNLMPDVARMKFFVDEAFAEIKERCASGRKASRNGAAGARAAGGWKFPPRSDSLLRKGEGNESGK